MFIPQTGLSLCKSSAAMTTCKRSLLLVGFVGSLVLMLSSYHFSLSQDTPLQTQKMRKQQLKEVCDSDKGVSWKQKRRLEEISDQELTHFIVDDKHAIIYCFIPKVACSNWKRVMFVLSQNEPYKDPLSVAKNIVHLPDTLVYLNNLPREERKVKLKRYTKFLFVRHPFVRLISAYRDKFDRHNEYFYKHYGQSILKLYGNMPAPPQTEDEAFASGIRPSFYNFIQYLLDPKTESAGPFEPHWRQMHRLCHPCLIDYDFIGHQETLQEDANLLLKLLKLEDDINFPPSYVNMTSSDSVTEWFSAVPLDDRRKLYKLYEDDFRLFGYGKPNALLRD